MDETGFPHRTYPCDECPVRCDNADNPKSKFPAERWDALRETVDDGSGGSARFGAPIFACHKGAPGTNADLACAGWLVVFGGRNMAIRMAAIRGDLDFTKLDNPSWPALYDTWDQMAAAQTLDAS
jgi:hypothetical protein